jgi:outer membrane protein OmpA-like peptidoglycan-associated protein
MHKTILKSDFIWSGEEDDDENYVSGLSHWVHLQDWLDPLGPDMIDPSNYSNEEEERTEIEDKEQKIYAKHGFNSGVGFWLGRNDVPTEGDPYAGTTTNPVINALLRAYSATFGQLSVWKKQWSGAQEPMVSITTEEDMESQRQLLYDYLGSWVGHGLRSGTLLSAPKYEKIMKKKYYRAFLTEINGQPFSAIHERTYPQRFMQSVLLLARFIKAGEDYLVDGDINKFRNTIGNFNMDTGYEVRLLYKKIQAPPATDKNRPVIRFQHIWNRAPDPIALEECELDGPPDEEPPMEGPEVIRFDLDGAHFNFDKIYPLFPDESKIFELPNMDFYDDDSYSLTIVGHTDKVGNQNYNKNLSLKRARALYTFITGNLESLNEGNLLSEMLNDMRTDDIQLLLNRVNDAGLAVDNDFGPSTKNAIKDFQENNEDIGGNTLDVDGIAGTKTKGAMVKQYLEWFNERIKISESRFLSNREWIGCGEYSFEDPDKTKSERNRRSEFLFFRPSKPLANLTECARNSKTSHCVANIQGDPERTNHRCKRYSDWLGVETTGTID